MSPSQGECQGSPGTWGFVTLVLPPAPTPSALCARGLVQNRTGRASVPRASRVRPSRCRLWKSLRLPLRVPALRRRLRPAPGSWCSGEP